MSSCTQVGVVRSSNDTQDPRNPKGGRYFPAVEVAFQQKPHIIVWSVDVVCHTNELPRQKDESVKTVDSELVVAESVAMQFACSKLQLFSTI